MLNILLLLSFTVGFAVCFVVMTIAAKRKNLKARAYLAEMVKGGALKVDGKTARKLAIDAVKKYKQK
jgi:hypothetical protein